MALHIFAIIIWQLLVLFIVIALQKAINTKDAKVEVNIIRLCLCITTATCQTVFIYLLIRFQQPVKMKTKRSSRNKNRDSKQRMLLDTYEETLKQNDETLHGSTYKEQGIVTLLTGKNLQPAIVES